MSSVLLLLLLKCRSRPSRRRQRLRRDRAHLCLERLERPLPAPLDRDDGGQYRPRDERDGDDGDGGGDGGGVDSRGCSRCCRSRRRLFVRGRASYLLLRWRGQDDPGGSFGRVLGGGRRRGVGRGGRGGRGGVPLAGPGVVGLKCSSLGRRCDLRRLAAAAAPQVCSSREPGGRRDASEDRRAAISVGNHDDDVFVLRGRGGAARRARRGRRRRRRRWPERRRRCRARPGPLDGGVDRHPVGSTGVDRLLRGSRRRSAQRAEEKEQRCEKEANGRPSCLSSSSNHYRCFSVSSTARVCRGLCASPAGREAGVCF